MPALVIKELVAIDGSAGTDLGQSPTVERQLVIGNASKAREQTLDECTNFYMAGDSSRNIRNNGNVRSLAKRTLETVEIVWLISGEIRKEFDVEGRTPSRARIQPLLGSVLLCKLRERGTNIFGAGVYEMNLD